jgi:hypothetical protein
VHAETLRADDPVVLPHLDSIGQLWSAVADVADHRARGWTLIGALMVMLHEHEAGTPTRPATADADAVVDARGGTGATRTMATLLQTQGWELDTEHLDVDGHGYKFVRDGLEFDVIAPEGMGARADLTTVPPLRAPQLAGTRQALDRTQRVVRGPHRHLEDLARLYRLVTDPAALTPNAKDRKRLRDTAEPTCEVLNDPGERAAARAARQLLPSIAVVPVAAAASCVLSEQPSAVGHGDGLGTAIDVELAHDVRHVDRDGLGRDEQVLTDPLVGPALGNQCQDLAFAIGEVGQRRVRVLTVVAAVGHVG